jgi:hypothetical protein
MQRAPTARQSVKRRRLPRSAPPAQTKVYLTTTAGTEFEDGGTYGVGTVVVAHFDEPITDRGAAEHSLQSRQARP